jgi:hypothetical protein
VTIEIAEDIVDTRAFERHKVTAVPKIYRGNREGFVNDICHASALLFCSAASQ